MPFSFAPPSSGVPSCIPLEPGWVLRGWTRAGRWSLNQVYSRLPSASCGLRSGKTALTQHAHTYTRRSPPPSSSLVYYAGLQAPRVHPVAAAQLSDGSPGEATNLREPGHGAERTRGRDRCRARVAGAAGRGGWTARGMDLCSEVDVYARQWINIGVLAGFSPGPEMI